MVASGKAMTADEIINLLRQGNEPLFFAAADMLDLANAVISQQENILAEYRQRISDLENDRDA